MTGFDTTWTPYAPGDKVQWDLRRVVHLHRRAGFAARCPWEEGSVRARRRTWVMCG
jgi:hypothetical protein